MNPLPAPTEISRHLLYVSPGHTAGVAMGMSRRGKCGCTQLCVSTRERGAHIRGYWIRHVHMGQPSHMEWLDNYRLTDPGCVGSVSTCLCTHSCVCPHKRCAPLVHTGRLCTKHIPPGLSQPSSPNTSAPAQMEDVGLPGASSGHLTKCHFYLVGVSWLLKKTLQP